MIRIVPSVITLVGLTLAVLGLALLKGGHFGAALALIGASQVADVVDGWAARRLDAVTDEGAALDYVSDVAVFVMAVCVALPVWGAGAAVIGHAPIWAAGLSGRRSGQKYSGRAAAVALALASALV